MADPNVYALSIQLGLDAGDAFADLQKFGGDMSGIEKNAAKMGATAVGAIGKETDQVDSLINAIKKKNEGHTTQNDLMDQSVEIGEEIADRFEDVSENSGNTEKILNRMKGALVTILKEFEAVLGVTEDFVQANYRAYGGIEQLVVESNAIAASYGVLGKEARAAYKAMADVRVPRDEIAGLTGEVARASRETGVGADVWATYVRRLRATGTEGGMAETAIRKATETMRQMGLTAGDMNRILGDTSVDVAELNFLFGEGSAENFTQLKMEMDGLGKSIGLANDAGSKQLNHIMQNTEAMLLFGNAIGHPISTIDDMGIAMAKHGSQIGARFKELTAKIAAGGPEAAAANIEMKALMKSHGFASHSAVALSVAIADQADKMGIVIDSAEKYKTVMAAVQADIISNETAHESMARMLAVLGDSWTKVKQSIMLVIVEALKPLFKVLVPIISFIAQVITKIAQFVVWLMKIPILGWVIKLFVGFVAVIALAVVGLIALAGSIGGMIMPLIMMAGLLFNLTGIAAGAAAAITTVAASIGTAIVGIGTSIATALTAMAGPLAAVALPIMGIGAALLMAGMGAWFFAKGVKIVAEMGWVAIPAILGMTAAIWLLGTVLIGLGGAAMLVMPGLLAVAVAILAVGAAVWLVGAGLMLGAQAFAIFAESLDKVSFGKLVGLGAGLVVLAITLMYAAPMLYTAAFLFAPAALLIAAGMFFLAMGLKALAPALEASKGLAWTLLGMSLALLAATPMLWIAAGWFLPAAILIGLGAIVLGIGLSVLGKGLAASKGLAMTLIYMSLALLVATPMLYLAAATFLPAAILVGVGALVLGIGLNILAKGLAASKGLAMTLIYMSLSLLIATPLLYLAAAAFLPAAILIGVGAFILGIGLAVLGKGLAASKGLAGTLIAMAVAILVASPMMYWAAAWFVPAAIAIAVGALILGVGLLMLAKGVAAMATIDLAAVGWQLFVGSWALLGAAPALLVAAYILLYAGAYMLIAGLLLAVGGTLLHWGVKELYAASLLIGQAATDLLMNSPILLAAMFILMYAGAFAVIAGALLFIGGLLLLPGVAMIFVAALVLIPAAAMMFYGASLLLGASAILFVSSVLILTAGVNLLMGSMLTLAGALILLYASGALYYAGIGMIVAAAFMVLGSAALIVAVGTLVVAALAIAAGALAMWFASFFMRMAVKSIVWAMADFIREADNIKKVGEGMQKLSDGLLILKGIDLSHIAEVIEEAGQGIGKIDALSDKLAAVAPKLKDAATKLQQPVNMIIQIFSKLNKVMDDFHKNINNIGSDIDKLGNDLNQHADVMDDAASRINVAVDQKAGPAMARAEGAGIGDVVRSEPISEVQVMADTGDEGKSSEGEAQVDILNNMYQELVTLNGTAKLISDAGSMDEIFDMLNQYMPNMASKEEGLASELNQYMN